MFWIYLIEYVILLNRDEKKMVFVKIGFNVNIIERKIREFFIRELL